MFGKIEDSRGSQARQKRNRNESQHTSTKRESSDKRGFQSQNSTKHKKRRVPLQEALQLSDKLKKLSREKKLDEALTLFWDSSNNKIRDGHHACIMVDMAARCGRFAEGENLLEKIGKEGTFISVETKTALLKVSSHALMSLRASEHTHFEMTC